MNVNAMPAWAGKTLFGVTALGLLALGGWVMTGDHGPSADPATASSTASPSGSATGSPTVAVADGIIVLPGGGSAPSATGKPSGGPSAGSTHAPGQTGGPIGGVRLDANGKPIVIDGMYLDANGKPVGKLPLPMTEDQMNGAAGSAMRVLSLMNGYQWDQDPKVWAANLSPMVSGDAKNTITQAFPSAGLQTKYRAEKLTTKAYVTITKVRLVADGQTVFEASVMSNSAGTNGKRTARANYWVSVDTVKNVVTSIQPAGTGN